MNPVIPEVVNQVCFQVTGNDITITFAAEAGQLQLNAIMPVIVLKTFESVGYMTTTVKAFTDFCVAGIQADVETCARPLASSVAQATSLVPAIGYEAAAKVPRLVAQGATLEAALNQVQAPQSAV